MRKQQRVRMRHPRLGGRVIEVPASAVPVHERAGWQREQSVDRARRKTSKNEEA